MVLDARRDTLYVLSHMAGKVSVIDTTSDTIVETIDLSAAGVPQGRTHYVPDIALDAVAERLYISVPEAGLLVKINTSSGEVMDLASPFAAAGDEVSGVVSVGRAQLAADERSHRVFLYDRVENELRVLASGDLDGGSLQTISFSDSAWDDNDYAAKLMTVDNDQHRLYVGPRVYQISSDGTLSYLTELSNVEHVIGIGSLSGESYLVAVAAENDGTVRALLIEVDGVDYDQVGAGTLVDMATYAPDVALDSSTGDLLAGYMDKGKLYRYQVE
jgi:DNA-binding beta-propeller fold protein YncE